MNQSSDFLKQLVDGLLVSIEKGTVQAYTWIWDGITAYLLEHLMAVLIILFFVLVYAIVRALMGHWWVLGSVLYNYLYAGALLLVGAIFGPAIFANTYASIGFFVLYVVCYLLVGKILKETGLKR